MKRNGKNRKILMGAAALLAVAVLAGCGKKPEAVKEETAENIEEKTEEISREEITEPVVEETAELPDEGTAESDGLGFCRVPNRSDWDGTYYREDGEYITVYDTDEDYLYLSYPESFDERMVDILQFTDAGKTQAVSATQDITAVYALSGDVLSIDFGTADAPYMQGIYYRKKDASCWRTEADGTERYLDETGKILRNHMTPDGWYADGDGRKLWEMGMLQITPGLYESMPAYSEREGYETWSFSMYSGAENSGFFNSLDQRLEVGTVDYTVYDQEMNPYYTKEAMYVYNSPDGYVIEDVSGQEFAWFYPSIHWNDLMIQMYGTEAYHTVRMIENYADYGG